MTDFQIKQLAIVAAVALIMAAILVYWIVDARKRRAEERAAAARMLYVRVSFIATDRGDEAKEDLADALDGRISADGIGHVERMEEGDSKGKPHSVLLTMDVALSAGRAAVPGLKRALRDIGIPADARLEYEAGGIIARERLGR